MKKALNNLKKSVPPKARIAILTAFAGIGVIAYLLISILTSTDSSDTPAENGLVKVDTVINSETQIDDNQMLSSDNSINRQIQDLNKKNIEIMKNDDGDGSYFDGVDLSKKTNLNASEANTEENNDVVDLGALFAETEEEKQQRESVERDRIETLETKLDIQKPESGGIIFDRNAYIQGVDSSLTNNASENNNKWENESKITSFKIKTYGNENPANKESSSSNITPAKNNSLTELAANRRQQYMSRYNDLKTDLEKRVNGNSSNLAASPQENSANRANDDKEQSAEYPSNKQYGAGEIIYAINDIEIVSSESNVVRVTVAQNGDVYNAILLGEFQQIGDVLGLSFNTYTVDGNSYPINAIAIDAETWKSGLADDVDQHYFSRYFGIISAALLEGYAESLTNTTQTNTESGVSESQERIESASERLQYAVGRVGEYLAPRMLQGLDRPSTVTVFRDKGIGIMFMDEFRVPARK